MSTPTSPGQCEGKGLQKGCASWALLCRENAHQMQHLEMWEESVVCFTCLSWQTWSRRHWILFYHQWGFPVLLLHQLPGDREAGRGHSSCPARSSRDKSGPGSSFWSLNMGKRCVLESLCDAFLIPPHSFSAVAQKTTSWLMFLQGFCWLLWEVEPRPSPLAHP